jgi:hypothetical protein
MTAEVTARWFTIGAARMPVDPVAGEVFGRLVAEVPMLRRSINVILGSETLQFDERISEPSWSRWLRFCACSLSSSSRLMRRWRDGRD